MLLSNMMTGMDATIINTALPAITSELQGLEYMGWIVATYLLGLAVSTPLWSKFGEHQGNKKAYIYATLIFAIGAIFQGMAFNYSMVHNCTSDNGNWRWRNEYNSVYCFC